MCINTDKWMTTIKLVTTVNGGKDTGKNYHWLIAGRNVK